MRNLPVLNRLRVPRFTGIKIILCLFLFSSVRALAVTIEQAPDLPVIGRWDITIEKEGKSLPSWLEVQKSGTHTLIGRFTYAFGSARPISEVKPDGGKFRFSIPPQWEEGSRNMDFEFEVNGDKLVGTMIYTNGVTYHFTGVRAPLLTRSTVPIWGNSVKLFNGKDTRGWHADGKNQWTVENGILRSQHSGANLISDQKFTDFKLHIEFRYQKGSNSGIYLRGRYEVQVIDTKTGDPEPINNQFSSVYGFLPPNKMMAKDAGQWQAYDITLIGRLVTIVANGTMVICKQEIPGLTGGAIDSKEGEPGPILIQGDHGPIDYRNIIITPVK
jgi:hypothetical protein